MRRGAFGQSHRPRSLSDLHQPSRFYIGERVESQLSMGKDSHSSRGRYGTQEEEGEEGGMDWDHLEAHSRSSIKGAEPPLASARHRIHSPR